MSASDQVDVAGSPTLLGQTLRGTYRVLGELDHGGMGTVYVGEHVRLHRPVAIKVLAEHLAVQEHALLRFQREAAIISQLQHPHIVNVLDFDTTPLGQPYLVMELLHGETLETRLAREQRLSLDEVVRIVAQCASGLAAAHAKNIVHRDLKPANVFLVKVPEGVIVKLLDFGISTRREMSQTALTGEYDVLGTPEYMAPEQAAGHTSRVNHLGDQFALAVMAYEMLAGATPFHADNVHAILEAVLRVDPKPLSPEAHGVSSEIDAAIRRALSKTPAARYADVRDFAASLASAARLSLPPSFATNSTRPPERVVSSLPPSVRAVSGPAVALTEQRGSSLPPNPSSRRRIQGSPAAQFQRAVGEARQALGFGNLDLAVSYAESCLRIADSYVEPAVVEAAAGAAELFKTIFRRRLGSGSRSLRLASQSSRPASVPPPAGANPELTPEQSVFLLRLTSGSSVDENLRNAPLTEDQALRALVGLVSRGLVLLD